MRLTLDRLPRGPLLARLGVLMSAVVLLAIVSMASSAIIAETNEGMATAVNQSGSLRMQSYRIGLALADASRAEPARAHRTRILAEEFEARLRSPRLVEVIPGRRSDAVNRQYAVIRALWEQRMKPPLSAYIDRLEDPAAARALPRAAYLAEVDAFVGEIDQLVRLLEEVAERRIDLLRRLQAAALLLTVLIVVVTMVLVRRRVIRPLGELLACADRVRRGDFSGRAGCTGNDELGRLGAAFNLMAEGLSELYGELERRVADKTRDLARTNHSLELLYRTSKTLHEEPVSEPLLRQVLRDGQEQLRTGPLTLCRRSDERAPLVSTYPAGASIPCRERGCQACLEPAGFRRFELEPAPGKRVAVLSFPVGDRERCFGVLLVDLRPDGPLEPWQERLLTTLAGHLGTALALQQRLHESRHLALHEERGIIARELHDSLAQSLSYLKIQVVRLAALLEAPENTARAAMVLEELREGISSAYRQLRELLTTFRLRMDDRGLNRALEETLGEFQGRSATRLELDNRLPSGRLSPNEEIHVLQIVREALSNVIRHAGAAHARIRLIPRGREVEVEISDDGRGYRPPEDLAHHYGLAIMRERSLSLNGTLRLEAHAGCGTGVYLRFRPRAAHS